MDHIIYAQYTLTVLQTMSNRQQEIKLAFHFHLATLPQSSLASQVYKRQLATNYGIVAIGQEHLYRWNIGDKCLVS